MSVLTPTNLETANYGTTGWNAIYSSNFSKLNDYLDKFADLWTGLSSSDDHKILMFKNSAGKWVKTTLASVSGKTTITFDDTNTVIKISLPDDVLVRTIGTGDANDFKIRTSAIDRIMISGSTGDVNVIGNLNALNNLTVNKTLTVYTPDNAPAMNVVKAGWAYRKAITVSNTSSALTNYQVVMSVDTASLIAAGKMRGDCGDIRFVDSDGTTQLPYWIESGINTSSTRIWLKIPSIPASSNKTIYMQYGNPSVSTTSNGDAVFEFFDDFNGTTLDTTKWTVVDTSAGSYSIANSILTIAGTNSGWKRTIFKSINGIPTNHEVACKVKWTYSAESERHVFNVYNSSTNHQTFGYQGYYDRYLLRTYTGTNYDRTYSLANDNPTNYEWWKIRFDGTTLSGHRSTDGSTFTQLASATTNIITSGFYAGVVHANNSGTNYTYFDYIYAKKYTSIEPTASVTGSEETLSTTNVCAMYVTKDAITGIRTQNPNSGLHINTSISTAVTSVSADTTLTADHHTVLVDATSGNITITLPTATGIDGREYIIKKIDSSSNTVTITPQSSQTIDGQSNYVLSAQNKYIEVKAANGNYYIIGNN